MRSTRTALTDITNVLDDESGSLFKPRIRKPKKTRTKKLFINNYRTRLGDKTEPPYVYDYDLEIFYCLLNDETLYLPKNDIWDIQESISPEKRGVLINWIEMIHAKLDMRLETLFLAVSVIDRVLAVTTIQLENFQLLGSAAIYVCVKMEEVSVLSGENLVFYAAESFNHDDLRKMERIVLNSIDFKVNVPTVVNFVHRFNTFLESDHIAKKMSLYISEVALILHQTIGVKPSLLAAAIVFLTRAILGITPFWPKGISGYTEFDATELKPTVEILHQELLTNEIIQNSYAKILFSEPELGSVSNIKVPDNLPL